MICKVYCFALQQSSKPCIWKTAFYSVYFCDKLKTTICSSSYSISGYCYRDMLTWFTDSSSYFISQQNYTQKNRPILLCVRHKLYENKSRHKHAQRELSTKLFCYAAKHEWQSLKIPTPAETSRPESPKWWSCHHANCSRFESRRTEVGKHDRYAPVNTSIQGQQLLLCIRPACLQQSHIMLGPQGRNSWDCSGRFLMSDSIFYMLQQFRPPMCLSVTCVHYIKTAEHIIKILESDGPIILVFHYQGLQRKSDGFTPNGGTEYNGASDFWPICSYISEIVIVRGIFAIEHEYKFICALSNSAIFDDPEWPQTPVSRSQYSLKANISQIAL